MTGFERVHGLAYDSPRPHTERLVVSTQFRLYIG